MQISNRIGHTLHKSDSALAGANLRGLDLRGADFWTMSPIGTDFSGALLNLACFIDADLTGALFVGAKMNGADLRAADLRGANLSEADLADAKFESAEYDARTVFPKGFNPARHSMTFRQEK